MQQDNVVSSASSTRTLPMHWLAVSGVVGPIFSMVVLTILGFLRPGYSQIRQAGSDLGIGPNGWALNVTLVITGLLLIAFAVGFFMAMQDILRIGRRVTALVLLVLSGVGFINAGVFTEAPATVTLHWTIGFLLAVVPPIIVFITVGRQWLRVNEWRGYGRYSLLTALGIVAFDLLSYAFFIPSSPLSSVHVGGLVERILLIMILAWYVVIGWRLFTTTRGQE